MAVKPIIYLNSLILLVGLSSVVLIMSTRNTRMYSYPDASLIDQHPLLDNSTLWPEGHKLYVFGYENNAPLFEIENLYTNIAEETRRYLDPLKVPNTFYYVWCGKRQFTFQQYLSVLSVIRYMRPDNIVFYYTTLPLIDEETLYNTWFDELRKNFPFISTVELNTNVTCSGRNKPQLQHVLNILDKVGGVYITEGTILTKPLDLDVEVMCRWNKDTEEGLLQFAPGRAKAMSQKELRFSSKKCPNVTMITERTIFTPDIVLDTPEDVLKKIGEDVCLKIGGVFYPRDFWTREDELGDLVRYVMYGTPTIRTPVKHDIKVVPNIAHMIWVGGGEMDFLFYLSVLSIVYIQQVQHVFIHGDAPPSGHHWESVKNIPQVVFRYRNFESLQIYGNEVGQSGMLFKHKASHLSDVIRGDIMLRWGGIYIDTDAFFVQKFSDEILRYDTVAHYSFARRLPYPDTFVSGLLLARPGAEFFMRFQESMKQYIDENWMYNALLAPYKIMERYPHLVHVEPHMQVVCLYGKCHPTWVPMFKNMSLHHLNTGSLPNWKNDTHVYHFCSGSTPRELMNVTALREAPKDSIFVQMANYILTQAGRSYD